MQMLIKITKWFRYTFSCTGYPYVNKTHLDKTRMGIFNKEDEKNICITAITGLGPDGNCKKCWELKDEQESVTDIRVFSINKVVQEKTKKDFRKIFKKRKVNL